MSVRKESWVGRDSEELAPLRSDIKVVVFFLLKISSIKKTRFYQKHFLFSGFFSPKMFIAYEVEWSKMLPGT